MTGHGRECADDCMHPDHRPGEGIGEWSAEPALFWLYHGERIYYEPPYLFQTPERCEAWGK